MVEHKDEVMTKSNEEGIERVYSSGEDYAFLMESKSIEYTTERKCNLTQVGKALDDKNYGIGMRKGMSFNECVQYKSKGIYHKRCKY